MSDFLSEHRDGLSNYLIVFGMGGFVIYASIAIASFSLKYGFQIIAIVKGAGL